MGEGAGEGIQPPKPMGRFVPTGSGDDRLPVAPLARPDVASANGGPFRKRGKAPL